MQAIRVTRTLDSETLDLPQLRPLVGQQVEMIVLSAEATSPVSPAQDSSANPLAGSVLHYADPVDSAVSTDEWEANQ